MRSTFFVFASTPPVGRGTDAGVVVLHPQSTKAKMATTRRLIHRMSAPLPARLQHRETVHQHGFVLLIVEVEVDAWQLRRQIAALAAAGNAFAAHAATDGRDVMFLLLELAMGGIKGFNRR
ncbi:hypothetical protein [Pseudacidovorax intermedius]|uniref:hypothetical protein n=1 Tax=Pseudacidovorax intermedius TaxID=433924 RepID=UPI0011C03042|nr:hypothetical protein [Pseudacidovorax intermedius]